MTPNPALPGACAGFLAGLALCVGSPAPATEDSAGPIIANVSVTPATVSTRSADARATVCAQVTDASSGVAAVELTFAGAQSYSSAFSPESTCTRTLLDQNHYCTGNGNPYGCCTGEDTGTCSERLPTCGPKLVGACRTVTDCVSGDDCSSGEGSTIETLVCDGDSWELKTPISHPSTVCTERTQVLPRGAPAGAYSVSVTARDRTGNATTESNVASIENSR